MLNYFTGPEVFSSDYDIPETVLNSNLILSIGKQREAEQDQELRDQQISEVVQV